MKLVLGDQSPWGRGLLRLRAVELLFPDVEECKYFWHDGDQAWIPAGGEEIRWTPLSKGSNYASIKLEVLGLLDEAVRQSVRAPLSQQVLIGPLYPPIIWWEERNLVGFISNELDKVLAWYNRLGGKNIPLPDPDLRPLLSWIKKLAKELGCQTMPGSFVEFFRNPEIQTEVFQGLSRDYWVIQNGKRVDSLIFSEGSFMIPRRNGLVKFFHQRGWRLVGSNIPYLRPDKDYLQVRLEIFEEDRKLLEDKVWEMFFEKKTRAGKAVKPRPSEILSRASDVLSKLALGYRVRAWTNDGREVIF